MLSCVVSLGEGLGTVKDCIWSYQRSFDICHWPCGNRAFGVLSRYSDERLDFFVVDQVHDALHGSGLAVVAGAALDVLHCCSA